MNADPVVSVSGRGQKWHLDRGCKWLEFGQKQADKNLGRRRLVSTKNLSNAMQERPGLKPCKHCAPGR